MKLTLKAYIGRRWPRGDYEYVLWCSETNESWVVKRGK